jgi:hypothetical protein
MVTTFVHQAGDPFARCIYSGSIAFPDFVELCKAIRKFSEENNVSRVLLDGTRATGDLSLLERYMLGDKATDLIGFRLRLSICGPKGLVREDKFGVMVARRRGAQVNIFTDLSLAERWLLEGD